MTRPTDKQLWDKIEKTIELGSYDLNGIVAYAQLRALERLADNVHVLNATLSVIRADLVKFAGEGNKE